MSEPRTDAGRALLLLAAYDGIALVAADSLRDRILAIEAEAEAEHSAGAAPSRQRLADALKAEGFVRGVASRYGSFNDAYWEKSAEAILSILEEEQRLDRLIEAHERSAGAAPLDVEALAYEQGRDETLDRVRAMRLDFRTLPHTEFPIKWPDWKDYEEVLPSYCGCQDCQLWRSGS